MLLVSMDEMYLANDPLVGIREIVVRRAHDKTQNDLFHLTMGSASDVEALCRAAEHHGVDPRSVLVEKGSRADTDALDIRTFVSRALKSPRKPIALHQEFLDRGWRTMLSPYLRAKP